MNDPREGMIITGFVFHAVNLISTLATA